MSDILNTGSPELGYASREQLVEFAIGQAACAGESNLGYRQVASRIWNTMASVSWGGQRPCYFYDRYTQSTIGQAELMVQTNEHEDGLLLNLDTAHDMIEGKKINHRTLGAKSIAVIRDYIKYRQLELYGLDDDIVV
jgi:hypothetical protein